MTAGRKTRLDDAEIETYRRDGLVVPDYRLPEDMLERMRAEVADLLRRHPDVRPEQLSGPHNPWGQSASVVGSDAWLDFCRHPEVLDMVEQLIGPDIVLWGSHLFCKPAGEGLAVPWHQDGQYWPIDPLATVTVRIAIDDSLVENGCMRYIPGSHRTRTLVHHEVVERDDLAIRQRAQGIDEGLAKDDVLRAGQISLHDVYLLHGSAENRSTSRRADYAIRYMPATSRYVREPSWPANAYAAKHSPLMGYPERPIWLVRGSDRAGNDFRTGHGPSSRVAGRTPEGTGSRA
ncbi:MAG: phytanoyl-CoA dioxygenase family protein [Lautropia sp.]